MKILGDGKAIIRMDTNKAVKQEKYFLKEARCRRHSASFLPYGKKQLSHCGGEETCREEEDESPPLDRTSLCKGKCVMRRTEHAASRGRRIFSTRLIGVKDI